MEHWQTPVVVVPAELAGQQNFLPVATVYSAYPDPVAQVQESTRVPDVLVIVYVYPKLH